MNMVNQTEFLQHNITIEFLSYGSDMPYQVFTSEEPIGFDDEGQLSSMGGTTYTFAYEHRLTAIGGQQSAFSYDGSGKRLKAVRSGTETRYVYDASSNLLAEADSNNVITKYYIHGMGLMAMVTPSDEVYTYHFNAIGNTIAMTDSSEYTVNMYAYTPFGVIANEVENVDQPFKYVGQYGVMAEDNGFYYMRARYYDPEVGRFISEDPIGFNGGDVNLYAYVGNNPMLLIDPLGLRANSSWGSPFSGGTITRENGFEILTTNGYRDSRLTRQADLKPLADAMDKVINNPITNRLDKISPGESFGHPTVDKGVNAIQILRGAWNSLYQGKDNRSEERD